MIKAPTFNEIIQQDIDFIRQCYDSPNNLNCQACEKSVCVSLVSVADFPSDYGHFKILAFVNSKDNKEHIMVIKGGSRTWISPLNNEVKIEEGDYIYVPKQILRSFRSYVLEYSIYVSMLASVTAILLAILSLTN